MPVPINIMAGQSNAVNLNGGASGQALQNQLDIVFGVGAAVGQTCAVALSGVAPLAAGRAHRDMIRDAQLGLTGGNIIVLDPDRIAALHGIAPAQLFGSDGLQLPGQCHADAARRAD